MSMEEMKRFIRNHFEESVNRKNLEIADVNFADDFVDHSADVPPGTAPGPVAIESLSWGVLESNNRGDLGDVLVQVAFRHDEPHFEIV